MCVIIVIDRGEKEIETPDQFHEHFKFELTAPEGVLDKEWKGECLCPFPIGAILKEHRIDFKTVSGDYYVGQLDQIKED